MPIIIAGVAPFQGWRQGAVPQLLQAFCTHTFEASPDGQLVHRTDGELRAVVPPEGWKDYCGLWPDAQPVVDALTRPAAAAPVAAAAPGADFPPI